jgi:ElaB/YqjD/DUF883 family membrane-anchored ribosome-binding protein
MNSEFKKTASETAAHLNEAKETVSNYVSDASRDTMNAAKQTAEAVEGFANQATSQVRTFASELERMGRNNPLGTIAGALLVGVVIGMMGRNRD